jgi:hypothetical protein
MSKALHPVPIKTEEAYTLALSARSVCKRWPFAGAPLVELRSAFGLAEADAPEVIYLPPSQYYTVVEGYLVPNYAMSEPTPEDARATTSRNLQDRTETLLIGRATNLINNAQPEIGVGRTIEEILSELDLFHKLPETNLNQATRNAWSCHYTAQHHRYILGV